MKSARRRLRRVVPESVRPTVKALGFRLVRPIYAGSGVSCPVCGRSFRRLLNVGSKAEPRHQCPGCGCYDRHRLLALHLAGGGTDLSPGRRVLHFAPEPNVSRLFATRPGLVYVTGDLGSREADVQLDITRLPLRSASIDLVLCSHVLEHVPNDDQAMAELLRVLATEGVALLQVPIKEAGRTVEIDELTSETERRRMAGAHGHVRSYGPDFGERLRSQGFDVGVVTPASLGGDLVVERYGIEATEELFVCRRPIVSSST